MTKVDEAIEKVAELVCAFAEQKCPETADIANALATLITARANAN